MLLVKRYAEACAEKAEKEEAAADISIEDYLKSLDEKGVYHA